LDVPRRLMSHDDADWDDCTAEWEGVDDMFEEVTKALFAGKKIVLSPNGSLSAVGMQRSNDVGKSDSIVGAEDVRSPAAPPPDPDSFTESSIRELQKLLESPRPVDAPLRMIFHEEADWDDFTAPWEAPDISSWGRDKKPVEDASDLIPVGGSKAGSSRDRQMRNTSKISPHDVPENGASENRMGRTSMAVSPHRGALQVRNVTDD
jgi:hypothetical protein